MDVLALLLSYKALSYVVEEAIGTEDVLGAARPAHADWDPAGHALVAELEEQPHYFADEPQTWREELSADLATHPDLTERRWEKQ